MFNGSFWLCKKLVVIEILIELFIKTSLQSKKLLHKSNGIKPLDVVVIKIKLF